MLPLQQAYEVKESILEYIRTSYNFKEDAVQKAFYDFIEDPNKGMIKGPYVSLKAPFVSAPAGYSIPLDIKPGFPPYRHQVQAFDQLTLQNGHKPENTLITTGTGSGKTECFLFPVLDYCYQHIGEKGIKVIILYPMNALATDQAKRLAELIYKNDRLRNKVTAGLFIGKGTDKKEFRQVMAEDGIIENRDTIVNNPPDILLTNFKMLDYGIMKSENCTLWEYNVAKPELLKYLVLDELHTYDGAQGTDVANLLRRLKLRLGIDRGSICGIGTSATIGDGTESKQLLCDYASDIFGEKFLPEHVIEEHRIPSSELFVDEEDETFPSVGALNRLAMQANETHDDYIRRQMTLWQCDNSGDKKEVAIKLGKTLSSFKIVRDIFRICEEDDNKIVLCSTLMERIARRNPAFAALSDDHRREVLESLLALIAEAKVRSGSILTPFMPLQVQLWVRELSGIRRVVSPTPQFTWKSDMQTGGDDTVALPMYYCRECGASGWIAAKSEAANKFETDGNLAAQRFMKRETTVWLLNTKEESHIPDNDSNFEIIQTKIKPDTLDFSDHLEGDNLMQVIACRREEVSQTSKKRSTHWCPECCENADDLSIVGLGSSSLSSLSMSQLLSSNLDDAPEQGRKTLTFTNGVQDAAYLASFYMNREYRFMMRASIQKVIEVMEKDGEEISLSSLYERFVSYWKEACGDYRVYLSRFFPYDYVGEIDLDKHFVFPDGTYPNEFRDEFNLRIFWEIVTEFGLMTSFGRSLERTHSAATYFKKEDIDKVYDLMKPWLEENLIRTDKEEFEHFMIGFLERSLVHGGIDHPYLEEYRKSLRLIDLNWAGNNKRKHFLNKRFGKRERLPKLLITYQDTRHAATDNTFVINTGWYFTYYKQCFQLAEDYAPQSNEFYVQLAKVATETGLFTAVQGSDGENYCINPEKVYLTAKVKVWQCDSCQRSLITSVDDPLSEGTCCIGNNCAGHYEKDVPVVSNYYQRIYRREKTPRIHAHEHTGLLDRGEREKVEESFKNNTRLDSYNALVATSTLEMGIDIGDLNEELNVSIPPTVANYLQRVGRVGRKSGAALVLDFARSDPHDLFFFEDPMEMMAGKVSTPGCYLNAKDILRRHFFAYCLDSWTADNTDLHKIPSTIRQLHPETAFVTSPDFFLNRVFRFVEEHLEELKSAFSRHYSQQTYEEVLIPMYRLFEDGSFESQVRTTFTKLQMEYVNLSQKITAIFADVRQRNLAPNDEEYKELMMQKSMLHRERVAIKKKQVLEFMTDEGLLPNYAFPETGVKLSANILDDVPKGDEGHSIPGIMEFEIVRSASAGLKDFAPGNHFYFNGYRLAVDGINTADWQSEGILVKRRFCSKCDCIETEHDGHATSCPKCGDTSFGSESNTHLFVDLKNVKSCQHRRDAVVKDAPEEREHQNYRSTFHFSFPPQATTVSYSMKDIPFGIEFVKDVRILETNLGEASANDARNITIHGQRGVPSHGFVTCRYCGKTVADPGLVLMEQDSRKQQQKWHYPYCKHKGKAYQQQSDDVFEEVYLSRGFQTEAIKVLLPVQQIDSAATVAMFKAGLALGLKEYFQGNPQHIQMRDYAEYNRMTDKFDNYVVMYDTIPGGTGYLAKLFDKVEFTKVLKIALKRLSECSCQFEGKDGCYHCVLSYENKYTRGQLSREKAENLFRRIVDQSDNWETNNTSLGTVAGTGGIEDSELEERFITLMKEISTAMGWIFETVPGFEFRYYKITVSNASGETRTYSILPQQQLGPAMGVEYTTRPDFLFKCIERSNNGTVLDVLEVPQIALYLDGYTYHGAVTDHNQVRFFRDFEIRESIHRSQKYISWTMTWADIDNYNNGEVDSMYIPETERLQVMWNQNQNKWKSCKNDIERFLFVLEGIDDSRFMTQTLLYLTAWSNGQTKEDWRGYLSFRHEGDAPEIIGEPYINPLAAKNSAWCKTRIAITGPEYRYNIRLTRVQEALDKDVWNHFWRLYNLLNLSKDELYIEELLDGPASPDIDTIMENYDSELRGMIEVLLTAHQEVNPEGGFSLLSEEGEILAESQLGVEKLKIAVDPYGEEARATFEEYGYVILEMDDIEKLKAIIAR